MTSVAIEIEEDLEPLQRLSRDLVSAARTLTVGEVRYLVDAYYQMQANRIRSANQIRQGEAEPNAVLQWFFSQHGTMEQQIKRAMHAFSQANPVGAWAESIHGIGPVLSAGLLAHIDITKAPTVGHIWRFAGLDPTVRWEKSQKRPWNARLKVICWKIGQSFVKGSGSPKDDYGRFVLERKAREVTRNEAGEFAEQAAAALSSKRWSETQTKAAYQAGHLPAGRLQLRAERYAVKLFLAHWHHVAFYQHFGEHPPKPYVLAHLGHAHEIQVPKWPF